MNFKFTSKVNNFTIMKLKSPWVKNLPKSLAISQRQSKLNATMHINKKVGNLQKVFHNMCTLHINDTYKDSH
jgi:hypothetical protein